MTSKVLERARRLRAHLSDAHRRILADRQRERTQQLNEALARRFGPLSPDADRSAPDWAPRLTTGRVPR